MKEVKIEAQLITAVPAVMSSQFQTQREQETKSNICSSQNGPRIAQKSMEETEVMLRWKGWGQDIDKARKDVCYAEESKC